MNSEYIFLPCKILCSLLVMLAVIFSMYELFFTTTNPVDVQFWNDVKNGNNLMKFSNKLINSEDTKEVTKALENSCRRAFGEKFIEISKYRQVIAFGEMRLFLPDGNFEKYFFDNEFVFYVLALFRGEKKNETLSINIFFRPNFFNPIFRSMKGDSSVVKFKEVDGNEFAAKKPYFDSRLTRILNQQSQKLKEKFPVEKTVPEKMDSKYWSNVKNGKNGKNTGNFIDGNINRNDKKEVNDALNTASRRAFGNRFVRILGSPTLVLANGTMYVTLPVGLMQLHLFNNTKVYYAEAIFLDDYGDYIIVSVFYKWACFNPLYDHGAFSVDSSKVTFTKIDGTSLKFKQSPFARTAAKALKKKIEETKKEVFDKMSIKNQKKVFFDNPGTPLPSDYKVVQESNTKGVFFTDAFVHNHFENGYFSKINVVDVYSEFVPEGDYLNCKSAFPKAYSGTLDGLVIMPGYYVEIYAKENKQGGKVFSGHGPLIIYNVRRKNYQKYNDFKNWVFDDFHQKIFPPSTRFWSKSHMDDWNGSVSIIKDIRI